MPPIIRVADQTTWILCSLDTQLIELEFRCIRNAAYGVMPRLEGHWHWRTLQCYEPLRLTTGLPQPCKIGLHLRVCPERLEGRVKNRGCSRVVWQFDSIVHPFAFTSCFDNAGTTKIGKMPRNLRLALVQNLYEVANAHLPAVHEV